ncbi:MAG: alpha-ketoacid dehydrogenase subunit beta [Planctomycetes bacterium]|nr:alpha-ketoacid dehydrogenase subunit beta [Planctomycetota bacterium]
MERQIEEDIDRAFKTADQSPFPEPESALADVYASPPYHARKPPWRLSQERLAEDPRRLNPAPVEAAASRPNTKSALVESDRAVTYIEAIRRGIEEEMAADPRVFILGEDIGAYGGAFRATEGLLERFGPERVIDTPIAESGIIGAAIGAALNGMRPIAEVQFIDFISCAFDQITNFAAKSRYRWGASVPIVIRGPCGGWVNGGPYHSQNVEAYFLHTPGLKIVAPATASDARGLIKSAIRDDDPVLYFEHKYLYRRIREELPAGDGAVPIGKAVRRRAGKDLTLITFSAMVYRALEAADVLAKDGVEAEVLDLRTLLPLDLEAILESVARTNRVIILHEANLTGGIGGELAAIIAENAFEYLDAPIRRVASTDTPVPLSPPLESYYLPQVEDVVHVARQLLKY